MMQRRAALLLLTLSLLNALLLVSAQNYTLIAAFAGTSPTRIIDNIPQVLPNGTISATVVIINNGSPLSGVSFVIVNNTFGWSGSLTTTSASIGSGESATFSGDITAPNMPGVENLVLQASSGGAVFGDEVRILIEVGCATTQTCNSHAQFLNGQCVTPTIAPCAYATADGCTSDFCDASNLCQTTQLNSTCEKCIKNCDYLGCDGRQCGTDGCGGDCGRCEYGTYCNSDGQCVNVTSAGTCTNPIPILQGQTNLTGVYFITANTSEGYHYHVIPCNIASTSPEIVWSFVVPPGQTYGFDFRSYNFDTVLDVRKDSCDGTYIGCNDDGTPPGNLGSRVARMIGEGNYLIIVKGYDTSQQGVVELRLSFQPKCIPKCNSQFCGDDECGGQCGTCGTDEHCNLDTFKCVLDRCTPNCDGKQCGFDGCGGYCGNCTDGLLCNLDTSLCQYYAPCDGLNPVCSGCNATQYCAADCTCRATDEPLPDLFVDQGRLGSDILLDSDNFKETSCAYREGCITGTGRRRLLRFSVLTTNQGHADIALPSPGGRPDLFSYSPCHGHYHFVNYAYYALLSPNGTTVVEHGRKQGYCVLDGSRSNNGSIPCVGTYTCGSQGISVGWSDTYTYDIDCQWIDITDVAPGQYLLFVELNRARKILESNYDNNKAFVSVTIPAWDISSTTTSSSSTSSTGATDSTSTATTAAASTTSTTAATDSTTSATTATASTTSATTAETGSTTTGTTSSTTKTTTSTTSNVNSASFVKLSMMIVVGVIISLLCK